MKKAKTTIKLIPLLSAIISVVFAFIMGSAYSFPIMGLEYGTAHKSTENYLANQQYVLINNLKDSPILYEPGCYATDVTLQYAIDYEFDLRIRYSLDWLGDDLLDEELPTDNVELIFANRDNVIVDENYIYYINYDKTTNKPSGLPAGTKEISLIAGVEIVASSNEDYKDKALTLTILETDIKMRKTVSKYDDNHILYSDMEYERQVQTQTGIETITDYRESAKAWLAHKQSSTMEDAYIMVYNSRYKTEVGVPSPGHNSAYSKTLAEDNTTITATWNGGNRAYAGVGLYVITGSNPLILTAKVSGTWRKVGSSSIQQYDNNIRFNYSNGWVGNTYDNRKLFEIKDYNYIIPANTACYVKIVDSVEITTAGDYSVADLNEYKLVVNEIEINEDEESTFKYDGLVQDSKITSKTIKCPDVDDSKDNYKSENVTIINTSEYSNKLFEFIHNNQSTQYYSGDKLILINNTAEKKKVTLTYGINFHISNGATDLYYEEETETTTEKLKATKFTDTAYFRDDKEILTVNEEENKNIAYTLPGTNGKEEYIIAPYSSVTIRDASYSVDKNFQTYITTEYGGFDAWLDLNVTLAEENSDSTSSDMLLEMSFTEGVGTISAKNISNEIIKSFSVDINLKANRLMLAETSSSNPNAPNDWQATFWKYYSLNPSNKPVQNQSKDWQISHFYSSYYSDINLTLSEVGTTNTYNGVYSSIKSVELKPNESVDLLTFTINENVTEKEVKRNLILTSTVVVTESDLLTETITENGEEKLKYPAYFVTKGVENSYIVNNSGVACYIRFTESEASNTILENIIQDGDYFYYKSIVSPGQILKTTSTISDVDVLEVGSTYSMELLLFNRWGSSSEDENGNTIYSPIVENFNSMFN